MKWYKICDQLMAILRGRRGTTTTCIKAEGVTRASVSQLETNRCSAEQSACRIESLVACFIKTVHCVRKANVKKQKIEVVQTTEAFELVG